MSYSFDQQATETVVDSFDLAPLVNLIGAEIAEGRFGQHAADRSGALETLRATGLYVADVEFDCQRLQVQLHALGGLGARSTYGFASEGVPAPVPVDLSSHVELWLLPFLKSTAATPLERMAALLGRDELAHPFVEVSLDDAIRGFVEQLLPFLRTRQEFARQQAGRGRPVVGLRVRQHRGQQIQQRVLRHHTPLLGPLEKEAPIFPMVELKVHTHRDRGRVHYSRAYFFSPHDVFGAPTTPAVGWIRPGIYQFGVQYPGDARPKFDLARFEVPPVIDATLMV